MPSQTIKGSKWWRFDFHTHTPASDDYGHGDASLKKISAQDWLKAAMQAKLDCVVVSDHNSGAWIDKLKTENETLRAQKTKHTWYRKLAIFPGAEISVADSSSRVHLLAVFDPSCDSQKVTAVLGGCGIKSGFGDDKSTSTTSGFIETVRKIKEDAADGIAIPAHIDGQKGLLEGRNSLQPELAKSLKSVHAAEFCDLHKFDSAEPDLKKAVDHLAKVAGSDAHKPDDIGKHYTWIKMGQPSIEGLRLALIDHEYCVKNQQEDPNHAPDIFLSTLTIQNMHHCGRITDQPFVTELHPHFNAIIGGRGTGKSTLFESIRIAARRDQNLDKEAPGLKKQLNQFMELFQNKGVMQKDSEILLELHRHGRDYQLRWRFDGEGSVVAEKTPDGWQKTESSNLQERFPISIFSQKQIHELASNPRGLLAVVDQAPEVNLSEWKSRWHSIKSQFLQLREQRRELLRQLSEIESVRTKLADVENDLKQYEEKGHAEVLRQYQQRSQQKNSLPSDVVFEQLAAGIRELASSAELSDFPTHLFDTHDKTTAELKTIHEQSAKELAEISKALVKLAESVDTIKTQRTANIASSAWKRALQTSVAAYEGLVKEYDEKKSPLSISLYGQWVQQRNELQHKLNKQSALHAEKESIEKQIDEALQSLLDLRAELLKKRQDFLENIIGSNAFVRMEVVPFGDVSTVENEYRRKLSLDDGKFVSSVLDREGEQGILFDFYSWDNKNIPESDLPQLISTIKSSTLNIAENRDSGNHHAFEKRLKILIESQPAVFDQLDAWWPEDMLRVKYSKDPSSGKFEDLERGSAGQKAAAILAFLLSHGCEPLLIDQPEDDLDNALIYDLIVNQIHENKNRRQLIIVTHNPNIVVNGDAELVHVLKFEKGQVRLDQQGGLEENNIRNAICNILEGGREAFDKRYQRITLEA